MAKGRKTGGKDFVAGDPRAGRPPMDADLKAASALTSTELKKILNQFLFMDDAALEAALAKPTTNQLSRIVGSILQQAVKYGDTTRLDFLLNRLVGKVQDKVEVQIPQPFIMKTRDGGEIIMGAKVEKEE